MTQRLLATDGRSDMGEYFQAFSKTPEFATTMASLDRQKRVDWADLCFYREANAAQMERRRPDVVFMGDSITFNWAATGERRFDAGTWIGRGISGQTTPQMLIRLQPDVVALRPRVVHIMGGTNDIAGNTGPTTDADVENNIRSMTDLALANGIRVVVGLIPPAASYPWSHEPPPSERIARINRWIAAFARARGVVVADYGAVLSADGRSMRPNLSNDGVHPNRNGYELMTRVASEAIEAAERGPAPSPLDARPERP